MRQLCWVSSSLHQFRRSLRRALNKLSVAHDMRPAAHSCQFLTLRSCWTSQSRAILIWAWRWLWTMANEEIHIVKSTTRTVLAFAVGLQHTTFFFLTHVQTPVTFRSGEWWSILVVRLAHSADLRSRLRHVSSAPHVAYSTHCFSTRN